MDKISQEIEKEINGFEVKWIKHSLNTPIHLKIQYEIILYFLYFFYIFYLFYIFYIFNHLFNHQYHPTVLHQRDSTCSNQKSLRNQFGQQFHFCHLLNRHTYFLRILCSPLPSSL